MDSDDFKKWAKIYLDSAETLHEIENRNPDYWIVCFYLLSHSLELAFKSNLTSQKVWGHNLKKLAEIYNVSSQNKLSGEEINQVSMLSKLNEGVGGLRYDNKIDDNFLPSTVKTISTLIKRLISSA
jgi:hypothetical protein